MNNGNKSVLLEIHDQSIGVMTFDTPDSAANIFDALMFKELNETLDEVEQNKALKGLVLISAKKSIFFAGADLKTLSKCTEANDTHALNEMILVGQKTFSRMANLKIPTIAAIHGACVGGGYEIALACDYRMATDTKATKVGLPETQLGIIPAWGGSTRLSRLIGLSNALGIIIPGKVVSAAKACKAGMVDTVVPEGILLEESKKRLAGLWKKKRTSTSHKITHHFFVAPIISAIAKSKAVKKTRGHYPAILQSAEVAARACRGSIEEGLEKEREAFVQLALSDVSKNLVKIFFLKEAAKKVRINNDATDLSTEAIKNTAVIGAGVMGSGIAHWVSARGCKVILKDLNMEYVSKGLSRIHKLYTEGVKRRSIKRKEADQGYYRIYPTAKDFPLNQTQIIVEAAVEQMELKKKIFADLDQRADATTILATNTSALSIDTLVEELHHPERVIGIHFFNPVHRMPLVEIIRGSKTSETVINTTLKWIQQLGKSPVLVKDSPGFVVNRILVPYLLEAGVLYEHGATARNLDNAMLEFGMPMGPMRLLDEVGIDVSKHVGETLVQAFPDRMKLPELLHKMIEKKFLGKKSHQGFYLYQQGKSKKECQEVHTFRSSSRYANTNIDQLRERLSLMMVNEAAMCLEEGIVDEAYNIDFAMIMGTGFAPFRGGPLRYADTKGVKRIVDALKKLEQEEGDKFAPCALLQEMAREGRMFY